MHKIKDVERNGTTFRVCHEVDVCADAPWENDEGTGIVSEWTVREKRPGELVLSSGRHAKRFYDFSATMKMAKAHGWGIAGDTAGMSRNEIVQRAVMLDFQRLKDWCDGAWYYLMIVVYPLTADGDELKSKAKYCSLIESDAEDLDELAVNLIDEFDEECV